MSVVYTDPNSGIYKDNQNNWFLKDGTPIKDYDPKTGAYEENDGTWYTFQGIALQDYCMEAGAYQETDGTWYDTTGNEVLMNSPLYNLLKAKGYDVSQNTTTQASQAKVSQNTTGKSSGMSWIVPVAAIVGLVVVLGIIYAVTKGKK